MPRTRLFWHLFVGWCAAVLVTLGAGFWIASVQFAGLADDALAYQQTMTLGNSSSSVYMAFQNVDRHAVFGVAFPAVNPEIEAKAALPQTFLDVFSNQVNKLQAS